MYNCQLCNFATITERNLERHMSSSQHIANIKKDHKPTFICDICNKQFISKKYFDIHSDTCGYNKQLMMEKIQLITDNAKLAEQKLYCDEINKEYKKIADTILEDAKIANNKKTRRPDLAFLFL